MGRPLDPLLTDLDRLVSPISPDRPGGEWLRYEGTYDQVREARREDDAGLPQGVWESELKRANWTAVEILCAEALALRSKDLQLAAWLLEAWIQLDSFAGAARGIELMRRLCSAFWEEMYPGLDGNLAARLAPIQWVNDKLPRRLRLLRVTHPEMEGMPAYSLADWEVVLRNAGVSGGTVTAAKFEQSVQLTGHAWFAALHRDVLATLEQVRAFDALVDEKAGKLAPGLIKFRGEAASVAELLETMLASTRDQAPEATDPLQQEVEQVAPEDGAAHEQLLPALLSPSPSTQNLQAAQVPATPGARIRSREEAYSLLEEIADFLHRNDPHSPTPYLIWRAVSWGEMHFDELLPELVRDGGELSDIAKLLRLDPPSGTKS